MSHQPHESKPAARPRFVALLAAVRAQRAQLDSIEAQLVELAEAEPGAEGEWLTLDETHAMTGVVRSRGTDPHRALKDFLRAREVETTRAGRSLLVRRTSLLAALERGAKAPTTTTTPAPSPDLSRIAERSGMKLVSSGGRGR